MKQNLRFPTLLASTIKLHVRSQICAPHLALDNLPIELILLILGHADCDVYSLIHLSHVCSRLRNVILGANPIWASITLRIRHPASLIDAIARRSGDLGLSVNIHSPVHTSRHNSLYEIFKHCHRWKSAFLSIDEGAAQEIHDRFPLIAFPCLRKFRVALRWCSYKNPCYQSWSLIHLSECSLRLNSSTVGDIIAFPSLFPRLTLLHIEVSAMKSSDGTENREVVLPQLRRLRITSEYSERGALGSLLNAVSCPSLKCLYYMLLAHNSDYIDIVENTRRRYSLLVNFTLHLIVNYTSSSRMEVFFEDILYSMPITVERIKIGTCIRVDFRIARVLDTGHPARHTAKYPNLKDLDFECEFSPENNFSSDLSDLLKEAGVKLHRYHSNIPMIRTVATEPALRTAGVLVDSLEIDPMRWTPFMCGHCGFQMNG